MVSGVGQTVQSCGSKEFLFVVSGVGQTVQSCGNKESCLWCLE